MNPETEALRKLIGTFIELRARSEENRLRCQKDDNPLGLAYFEGRSDALETCTLHVRQALQAYLPPPPHRPAGRPAAGVRGPGTLQIATAQRPCGGKNLAIYQDLALSDVSGEYEQARRHVCPVKRSLMID